MNGQWINIYIYIYICIHIHAYAYTYTYTCVYIYTHIHMYTHTHIYIYTYLYSYIYIFIYLYIYICTHTHTHIYIYTYTCTSLHRYPQVKTIIYLPSEVLFLGQLLGISTTFPALWLPAALRGQGHGVSSSGRIWMALLLVLPITLVECLGVQPTLGAGRAKHKTWGPILPAITRWGGS